jgi:isopentenyl-diphosphate delta-isomerase
MIGTYNDDPIINSEEVEAFKWMTLEEVKVDMELNPALYTAWFTIIFKEYYTRLVHA